jgi:hypothetical protein
MNLKQSLKTYVTTRYRHLTAKLSKVDDDMKLNAEQKFHKKLYIKERIEEVTNMASQFGVKLKNLE